MAAEVVTGLGADLLAETAKSNFGTIKRWVLYVFKYKSYVNDLNDRVQQLNLKRERVEVDVDHARRQGDEIHKDVGKWLEDVKQFVDQKADPIIESKGQVGTCSLITRFKVGRKAVKAAKACGSLLGKDFSSVSYCPALQRTESLYVDRDYEAFDSRESILSEILEALKDPHVNRIGVYGMGGVGKTTLVKKVAWQAKEDNVFDDVVMVEVTEKPDYIKIQEKVAYDLNMEFRQHENQYKRADRIHDRLKKGKRVLVILDNIWTKPDLDTVGIPSGTARGNEDCEGISHEQIHYKILVTSRRLDMLCNYMSTNKNFSVPTLSNEETQHLFWKIVGSVEKIGFHYVAEEIIEKCGGLPLAVTTIAKALKNKDLYAWEDALGKLQASNPIDIPEIDKDLYSVIKLSFDLLNSDEAKSLLLLLSLVDGGIGTSYDYLLRYGMGLRLFKDIYTLEQGRRRVATLISDLKASCLLLEGGTRSWVKMHEVVHVVAASIASTNNFMFNIQDVSDIKLVLEEKISKNSTAISLPYRDISELPERLECPKLELFFLFMKSHCLTIPNNFFEGVKELKVIDVTRIDLMSVPSSFGYLTNLRTLCLDECLLGDISIIGRLTNLEILSFSRSNIERLPKEIGQLTRLQLLDLSRCSLLKVIPANVISKLSRLEELDLEESFAEWEGGFINRDECNANLVELNQLSHLTTLRVCIPDAQIIPMDLFIQELKRFTILIGDVWKWSQNIEASKTLKLKLNTISYSGYGLIKRLLKITDDLFLDELNNVQDVLYELDEEGFKNLKYLHVQNGPKLRYIVNANGQIPCDAFLMLEALSVNNLVDLVKICHGPLKEASFNKLKSLKVNECHELKHLCSISIAKCLSQLQEIEVTDCKNLQAIFVEENDKCHWHDDGEANSKTKFTQLRSLTLKFLPQFISFCFNDETLLGSRTEIIVEDNPEDFKTPLGNTAENVAQDDPKDFKTLFGKRVAVPNLEKLVVWQCDNLKSIFPASIANGLLHLKELTIESCMVEEIVAEEEVVGAEKERISEKLFPKLHLIRLTYLRKLKRFCNFTGDLIELFSLSTLIICMCPNMETFISNSISVDMTRNEPEEMNSEDKILANTQPLFHEKVSLPNLERLEIWAMDTLRRIWEHDQVNLDSFSKLQEMIVGHCNQLLHIFPSIMYGRLQKLEKLWVWNCNSLEMILKLEALGGRDEIVFKELKLLRLRWLPSLRGFYTGNCTLKLPSLDNVTVRACSKMEFFSQGIVNSSKLREVKLIMGEKNEETDEQCEFCREWEGDLNTTIQHIFRKLNAKTSEQD